VLSREAVIAAALSAGVGAIRRSAGTTGSDAMKVVLFCGGQGARLRDQNGNIPKPMLTIGRRPILWHLMKYYAHYGHTDFVLCLGYRSEAVKEYFLQYNEWVSNDFVLSEGGRKVEMLASDISDWRITFVDTGLNASIGERLRLVQPHVAGEAYFLANYADALTDLKLDEYIAEVQARGKVASFVAVHSPQSFHITAIDDDDLCTGVTPIGDADIWMNGGFFVLRQDIFSYMRPGEDLVNEPFARLIAERQLMAHRHRGFWHAMDTFKDRQALEERNESGNAPWLVWVPGPVPAEDPGEAIGGRVG
jgi:glucose-1-phosphate cytidylyltransferase